jgi:hypothetical protein
MQAMHGSAGARHSRHRLIGCVIALLALTALIAPSMASAMAKPPPIKETYLALGDSLAFGYSTKLYNEGWPKGDPPQGFENGYANDYLKLIKGTANGIQLVNNGCPGETTESFIGKNLAPYLDGALKGQREKEEAESGQPSPHVTGEAPCGYQEAYNAFKKHGLGGPLHHPYVGKSQLESTLETIAVEAGSSTPVTTISFNIGANDELHFLTACEKQAEKEVGENAAKGKYNEQVGEEIAKGEFTVAEGAGTEPADKERGEKDARTDGEHKAKECISKGANGLFAQIAKNTQGILLAIRNGEGFGGINYNGLILYQGGYNPYGEVFAGQGEEKPGTNELAGVENLIQAKVVHAFGACFTDPQLKFNPRNKNEPIRLDEWTSMTVNVPSGTSEFEVEPGVFKPNGPDIHPTPLGYKKLASLLKSEGKKELEAAACLP